MMRHLVLIPLAMLVVPPALAADERRLSAAEVEQILEKAALKREAQPAPAPRIEAAKPPPRPIEGEMGVAIGTGGFREAFGTAVVPLGEDGVAIVSFDTVQSNRGKRRRR